MNVNRALVSTFKLGDIVTLNYINHMENDIIQFKINRLPNRYIPSFGLIEINPKGDKPRVKEEIVQYITKYKSKTI